jgi:propane monooxygenase small subunit
VTPTVRTRQTADPLPPAFAGSRSRRFTYFEPQGGRASVYEDVTIDVQPAQERHLPRGWIFSFPDGSPPYDAARTALRSSDWHAFRDPNAEWERTLYRRHADSERQIASAVGAARSAGTLAAWAPAWASVVDEHLGAWMHGEQALGMHVLLPAQREAPSNAINNAIAVACTNKLRAAQDLALYRAQLPGRHGTGRESWTGSEVWVAARRYVERLAATHDWAEALFATELLLEPLVGELVRRELVLREAPWHGDAVTPVVAGIAARDHERDRHFAEALFAMLAHDREHAAYNREMLRAWVTRWRATARAAAEALAPLWASIGRDPVAFDAARGRTEATHTSALAAAGVPEGPA